MVTPTGDAVTRIPVGPCPLWCTLPRGHAWDEVNVLEFGDYGRTHVLDFDTVQVSWTEVPQRPDHRTPVMDVDAHDINSESEAKRLIAHVRMASALAFSEVTR